MNKTASNGSIVVVNVDTVPVEDLTKNGAEKVNVQHLIDQRHGSNYFYLRKYSVHKGGRTPLDQHLQEHQVYVLSGRGVIKVAEEQQARRELRQGDVVFVPSNAVHQSINDGDEPFVFLCVRGNPKLYAARMDDLTQGLEPYSFDKICC